MYYSFYAYKMVAKKVSPLLIELYPKICSILGVQLIVRELTSLAFVYLFLNFIFLLLVLR